MSTVISESRVKDSVLKLKYKLGSLISYYDHRYDKNILGILDRIDGEQFWAYWQCGNWDERTVLKKFESQTLFIELEDLIIEKDWSLIKNFRNIPKIALRK